MKKMFLIVLIISSCFSCASYTITQVTETNRHEVTGLRYFLPKPYLLVAEKDLLIDGVTTVTQVEKQTTKTTEKMAVARKELHCSVIYFPDPQKEFSISTTQEKLVKIHLADGWRLTNLNSAEVVNEISQTQLGMLTGTPGLVPGVYSIEYADGQLVLKKVEIIQ